MESQTRFADLEDIEPEDFARYLEYAYRYDYTVPTWVKDESNTIDSSERKSSANIIVNDSSYRYLSPPLPPSPGPEDIPPTAETPCEIIEDWPVQDEPTSPYYGFSKKETTKPVEIRCATLRPRFDNRKYLSDDEPKAAMNKKFMPVTNSTARQNFTPVFLAHARLYTFAGMRMVDPLKNLVLHKLHTTLLGFKLYHQRVGDVIELARYAYEHGKDREDDGTMDELRTLVVEYIACELSTFGRHKAFLRLMEDGGEFVGDFWNIVMKDKLLY